MSEETITLLKSEYEDMRMSLDWLACLENAGVDNWSGYEYALELRKESQLEDM